MLKFLTVFSDLEWLTYVVCFAAGSQAQELGEKWNEDASAKCAYSINYADVHVHSYSHHLYMKSSED